MGNMFTNYESLFKFMEDKVIDVALTKVSEQVRDIWKQMVEDEFYGKFDSTGSLYERTWETLDSITIIETKKIGDVYSVTVAYDETKIKYYPEQDGLWNKHANYNGKFIQDMLVEYGWNHYYQGRHTQHEGAHVYEYLLKYLRSSDFTALFNAQVRKLGYEIK